jgi:hypothetical protein
MLEHENVGAIEVFVPSAQHLEMIVDARVRRRSGAYPATSGTCNLPNPNLQLPSIEIRQCRDTL